MPVVKLGQIAEVKQGLATGDNDAYLFQNPAARGTYRSIDDYHQFLLTDADLTRIQVDNALRLSVIEHGISTDDPRSDRYFSGRYIVRHDKGGESDVETGWLPNYYVETNYYIDWSEWAVNRIKTLLASNGRPASRFQNTSYYFVKGIDYSQTGIYCPTFRANSSAVFNTEATSIFSLVNEDALLALLCSKMNRFFIKNFIDNTVHASADKLKETAVVGSFDENGLSVKVAQIIAKQKVNPRYDYASHEQIEIDRLVYEACGLNTDDIQEVETWYARRYPKLAGAQARNRVSLRAAQATSSAPLETETNA